MGQQTHPLLGEAYAPSMSMARLGKLARVSNCETAATAAVSGLSLPKLVAGTPYYEEARIPTSAFQRGATMERLLAENGHAKLIALCREHLGFELTDVVAVNLRDGYQRSRQGLAKRAKETRRRVAEMLVGGKDAPNLIDGAVLTYQFGNELRYAEVDAAGLKAGGKLHVIEVKSHPLVDAQLLGGAKPAWKLQMSIYLELLRALVTELGHDPDDVVANTAMLVLAKNTSVQPTATLLDLREDRQLAAITLQRLSDHDATAKLAALDESVLPAHLPPVPEVTADPADDADAHAAQTSARDAAVHARVAHVAAFLDALGTEFGPNCIDSCDLFKLCRERNTGRIAGIDPALARTVPGVTTFAQATVLAANPDNAPPTLTRAAADLARAQADLDLADRIAREAG